MNEQLWKAATDSWPLLMFVAPEASTRQLMLFACASCRRVARLLTDDRSTHAIGVVERYVDGFATEEEMGEAKTLADQALKDAINQRKGKRKQAELSHHNSLTSAAGAVVTLTNEAMETDQVLKSIYTRTVRHTSQMLICEAVQHEAEVLRETRKSALPGLTGYAPVVAQEVKFQADFVRDIFGNPFRPKAYSDAWKTADVVKLGRGVYDAQSLPDGALSATHLAVLADALEEAGCTNDDILQHCRESGPHVRGCWVVDWVLGKK